MTTDTIVVGKDSFTITNNILEYDGRILSHTYKLGGTYNDCVHISYIYSNNIPTRAKIPHLLYEPELGSSLAYVPSSDVQNTPLAILNADAECSLTSDLERGSGTERMIQAAIRYAYKDVPSVPIFEFDDNSHIDCVSKDMSASPPRKPRKPVNLAFFSIVYNGMTWYEARFNAAMTNSDTYASYKKRLEFLTDPVAKVPFDTFLEIIGISIESEDQITYIQPLYVSSNTYREFFHKIPKDRRCDVLAVWLHTFMTHYIRDVFSHKGWQLDVRTMNQMRGGNGNRKRRTRKIGVSYRIFEWSDNHNL